MSKILNGKLKIVSSAKKNNNSEIKLKDKRKSAVLGKNYVFRFADKKKIKKYKSLNNKSPNKNLLSTINRNILESSINLANPGEFYFSKFNSLLAKEKKEKQKKLKIEESNLESNSNKNKLESSFSELIKNYSTKNEKKTINE